MELYEAIYKRRTVREFLDKEVDFKAIKRILEAGNAAPTWNHNRNWSYIILRTEEEKEFAFPEAKKIADKFDADACLNRPKPYPTTLGQYMYAHAMPRQYKLGLEPSSKKLTAEYLKDKLGTKKKPIKEMLHDQSVVAGIGNIYSDEILFVSGIYPEQKCSELYDNDWNMLAEKIPEVITWGIRKNKMTPEQYLEGQGKEYRNTPHLRAYGHEGKPCPNCGTLFEKITVGGRSSCFCPNCQRKK